MNFKKKFNVFWVKLICTNKEKTKQRLNFGTDRSTYIVDDYCKYVPRAKTYT